MARKNLQISFNFFIREICGQRVVFSATNCTFMPVWRVKYLMSLSGRLVRFASGFILISRTTSQFYCTHNSDGFPSCCVRIRLKVITEGWESKEKLISSPRPPPGGGGGQCHVLLDGLYVYRNYFKSSLFFVIIFFSFVLREQGIGRVEANPHTVHLKLKTRQTQQSGFNSRFVFQFDVCLGILTLR